MAKKRKKAHDARDIFQRTLGICASLLAKCEAGIAELEEGQSPSQGLTQAARDLGALVNQMTKTQEAMHARGMASVAGMSLAEQFNVALRWLSSLPVGYRQKAVDALTETLKKKGGA